MLLVKYNYSSLQETLWMPPNLSQVAIFATFFSEGCRAFISINVLQNMNRKVDL